MRTERSQRIRELESLALKTGQTQLFIETPYRNAALWQALVQTPAAPHAAGHGSRADVAHAQTRSQLVQAVAPKPCPTDNRTPAVFAIGR
jgi:16S rRNA (cytidine1402-2'-O)-methyltransferase